jgi:hypothetical protein
VDSRTPASLTIREGVAIPVYVRTPTPDWIRETHTLQLSGDVTAEPLRCRLVRRFAELVEIDAGVISLEGITATTGAELVDYYYGHNWIACGGLVLLAQLGVQRALLEHQEPPPGVH